jgi:recombination protein RecA
MSDKAKAIVDGMRKELGDESATLLRDGEKDAVREVIPTGIDVLDHYGLGIGGLPVGRIVEIYSEEGGGKTTFGHTCLASAQRVGGVGALAEMEGAFDVTRANTLGVDTDNLIILNPDWIEQVVIHIEKALDQINAAKAWPAVIVWDSIAQTPTKEEFEEGMEAGKGHGTERAKCLSKAMRTLVPRIKRSRTVLICINQVRDNVGVMFGDKYTTPGGHAVKFASSIRLQILGGKKVVDKAGEHTGKDITIMVTKNRMAAPFRKPRVRLDYASGWDNDWSTLNLAKDKGFIGPRARGADALKEAHEKLGWNMAAVTDPANTTGGKTK